MYIYKVMPIDLALLGKEGRKLNREWKDSVKKHNSYSVKNKFHKERKMDEWNAKLNSINTHYRNELKEIEKTGKDQVKELEKMRKEEEHLLKVAEQKKKEAEQKKKEAALVKRRLTKEQRKLELSKVVPRRSSRFAPKKRARCPNGTRKNKKTGQCQNKSAKARKRCPNGTRKNKKSGKCQ